jgi:hypothetical protein
MKENPELTSIQFRARLAITLLALVSACSPSPHGTTSAKLRFSLNSDFFSRQLLPDFLLPRGKLLQMPDSVSGFHCYALNVMGDGILGSLSTAEDVSRYVTHLTAGGYCSYRGILSSPITQSASVLQINIPRGNQRMLQFLGVSDPTGSFCNSNPGTLPDQAAFYELARSTVDVFADLSVSLESNYNSLSDQQKKQRLVRCTSDFSAPLPFSQPNALPTPPSSPAVSGYCADKLTRSPFAGGSGTVEDPYQICNVAQFNYVGDHYGIEPSLLSANYVLLSDLDFRGQPFQLFGAKDATLNATLHFSGTFDGNGYMILGATYSSMSGMDCIGVFPGLVSGATIKNLYLFEPSFTSTYANTTGVGSLVGCMESGSITRVAIRGGTVSGLTNTGGLIGKIATPVASVSPSTASIAVSEVHVATQVQVPTGGNGRGGGLVGSLFNNSTLGDVKLSKAFVVGRLTGSTATCGGLLGELSTIASSNTSLSQIVVTPHPGPGPSLDCYANGLGIGTLTLASGSLSAQVILGTALHSTAQVVAQPSPGSLSGFSQATNPELLQAVTYSGWDTSIWGISEGFLPRLLNLPLAP